MLQEQTTELPRDLFWNSYSEEQQTQITLYLQQLTPIERKAYCIAHDHLQSSFNISKSNGFINWLKNK